MSVTKHLMGLHPLIVPSRQPHADGLLSMEAERCASAVPGSRSDGGCSAHNRAFSAANTDAR